MTTLSRRILAGLALLVLGMAAGVGVDRLWHSRSGADLADHTPASKQTPQDDDEEPEPAAIVRTVTAVQGELHRTVEAIGVAAIPPTATFVESWPTDVIIVRVLVQPGQSIDKDSPLVQVAPTRDAETQLGSAQLAVENTTKALEVTQQRLDRALGTRTELLAAQAALADAKQRLERLQSGLPPKDGLLRAHAAGLVGTVRAQPGSTVVAGTPIADIISDAVVAQLGLDPAHATDVRVGLTLDVRPIDDRAALHWSGTVSLIAPSINPTTRLIDVTLTLAGESLPRPGTPLRARAALPGVSGVIIPRSALMPDGDEMVVFVVRDGTAVRTPVTVTQRGDEQVLLGSGCASGDHVVVSGQAQLTQGATVRELAAEPKPSQSNGGAGADR